METKLPDNDVPRGQVIMFNQLVKRGDTVLIVHGEEDQAQHIKKLTPFGEQEYENANNNTLRSIVENWFRWADKQEDMPAPHMLARILRERMGADYCDTMMSEWVKMGLP